MPRVQGRMPGVLRAGGQAPSPVGVPTYKAPQLLFAVGVSDGIFGQ
jgi:hypothetical protein